jgi:dTDP-glucose 4,6-dehydratase
MLASIPAPRTVVITGGAGFVGSALVRRFLGDGWAVVALDDYCTGRAANIEGLGPALTLMQADVSVPFDIEGPVDAVLHFASPASPPDYLARPVHTLRAGSLGTYNALELAERKGARFLMASTSEIYGDPLVHPQVESYWGNVNPIGPRSVYDEAKRFSEAATMAWHRERGLDTRIIRIFNTYGPRMRPDDGRVVPNFACQALRHEPLTVYGDGLQTRSFCFVDDLVEGIMRVLEHGDAMPFNLGNPTEHTVLELVEILSELLGGVEVVRRDLPTDDPKRRNPDISRARDVLGWTPTTTLRVGLAETLDDFRRQLKL